MVKVLDQGRNTSTTTGGRMQAQESGRVSKLALGMILAGVIVVIGALLPWFEVSSTGQEAGTVKGTELSAILGVLVLGVLLAVGGVVLLLRARRGDVARRGWATAGIVFASLAALLSLYSFAAPEPALTSLAAEDVGEQLGLSEASGQALLEQAFASGELEAAAQPGSMVASVGALGGLVAAILARRKPQVTETAPPEQT